MAGRGPTLLSTVIKRLYSKIIVTPNECWEWQGYRFPQGYGRYSMMGQVLAHRVSFIVHKGPIFKNLCVLHKCDNPPCVNPDHLFMGTRDTNNKDRAAKGRSVTPNMNLTHCKRGHEFTKENTIIRGTGTRLCRTCNNEQSMKRYWKHIGRGRRKGTNGGTHCAKGHEFTKENTRINNHTGHRACKACIRERQNAKIHL
jgi:hypothetical protein